MSGILTDLKTAGKDKHPFKDRPAADVVTLTRGCCLLAFTG